MRHTTRIKDFYFLIPEDMRGELSSRCGSCKWKCCVFGEHQPHTGEWLLKLFLDERNVDMVLYDKNNNKAFAACYLVVELLTAGRINEFLNCCQSRFGSSEIIEINVDDFFKDRIFNYFNVDNDFLTYLEDKKNDCFPGIYELMKQFDEEDYEDEQ